jgi:hypothetical protein
MLLLVVQVQYICGEGQYSVILVLCTPVTCTTTVVQHSVFACLRAILHKNKSEGMILVLYLVLINPTSTKCTGTTLPVNQFRITQYACTEYTTFAFRVLNFWANYDVVVLQNNYKYSLH